MFATSVGLRANSAAGASAIATDGELLRQEFRLRNACAEVPGAAATPGAGVCIWSVWIRRPLIKINYKLVWFSGKKISSFLVGYLDLRLLRAHRYHPFLFLEIGGGRIIPLNYSEISV